MLSVVIRWDDRIRDGTTAAPPGRAEVAPTAIYDTNELVQGSRPVVLPVSEY